MSLRKKVLNPYLRLVEKTSLAKTHDPSALRKNFEAKAKMLFRPVRGAQFSDDVLTAQDHKVPVHWVEGNNASRDVVIMYLHGGGYVFGSPKAYRAMLSRLVRETGYAACLPDYSLAPEAPFPAAVQDALTSYTALVSRGHRVIIGGDSAGGGLAFALLSQICGSDLTQPLGCFAFSPLTDLGFSGESFVANAKADVVLPAENVRSMAKMYLGDADPKDPRASPLFADYPGAAPVWLAAGDTEILLDDTRRMVTHLDNQGVPVTLTIANDLPHVWPLFQGVALPEANDTLNDLATWIAALSPKSES